MSDYSVRAKLGLDDQLSGPLMQTIGTVGKLAAEFVALATAGYALKELAGRGIAFNKTLEDTRGGIAGVLLATKDFVDSTGRVAKGQDAVNAAFAEAKALQKDLVVDASKTAASYQELVTAFQAGLAPAAAAGVEKLSDVREITVAATQAMTALGIPTVQAAQEIRGMFSGEIGPDNRLNQLLRITKDDLAKVAGNTEATAQLFKDRLAPFAAAAAMQTGTLTVRLSNLGDVIDQSLGTATEGLFEDLSKLIADVTAGVGEAAGVFSDLKTFLSEVFGVIRDLGTDVLSLFTGAVSDAGMTWRDVFRAIAAIFLGFLESVSAGAKWIAQAITSPLETLWGMTKTLVVGLAALLSEFLGKLKDVPVLGTFFSGAAEGIDSFVVSMTTADPKFASFAAKAEKSFGTEALSRTKRWLDGLDAANGKAGDSTERLGTRTKKVTDGMARDFGYAGKVWTDGAAAIAEAAEKARFKVEAFAGGHSEAAAKIKKEAAEATAAVGDSIFQGGIRYEEGMQLLEQITATASKKLSLLAFEGGEAVAEGFIFPVRQAKEDLAQAAENLLGVYTDAAAGVKAASLRMKSEVRTAAESTASYVLSVFDTVSRGFEDTVFATISGRTRDLGDIMQGIFDSILRSWANLISDMVKRWLAGTKTIEGATPGAGGTATTGESGSIMAGVGNILGAVGVARAFGGGKGGGRQLGSSIGAGAGFVGGTILAMSGGALAAALGGSAAGVGLGAAVGSVVPIIGTIIGAAIGALLGSLLSGSTEKKVSFTGNLMGIGRGPSGQILQEKKAGLLGGLADIFAMGAPDQKSDLLKWSAYQMQGVLQSMNVQAHAGSGEDLDKAIQRIINEEVPRWMLREAFGQTPTGKHPDLPGIKGIPEFISGSFNSEAPIPKMLEGLGVTAGRIREIAAQIDSRAPEEFLAYLNAFVGVVAGFRDLTADLGKSVEEVWQESKDAKAKSPAEGFREQAQKLVKLAGELSLYTGDEQIKRAQELQQLVGQYRDAEKAYLVELLALSEKLGASLDAQAKGYLEALDPKTGVEQLDEAWSTVWSGWGKLYSAKSGAEVEQVAAEMAGAIDVIFEQMLIRVRAGEQLMKDLEGLAGDFGSLESDVQKALSREKNPIAAMNDDAADIHRQAIEAAKLSGAEQLEAIAKIRDAGLAAYTAQARFLETIARQAAALRASIDAQKWEIDLSGMDSKGQATSITDRIRKLQAQLAGTTSAEEAQRLTQEIQSLVSRYLGTFEAGDAGLGDAREWAKSVLDKTADTADAVYAALAEQAKKAADKIREDLEAMARLAKANVDEASEAIKGLSGTLRDLKGVVEEVLRKLGEDVTAENNPLRTALEEAKGLFTNAANAVSNGLAGDRGVDKAADRARDALDRLADAADRAANGYTPKPQPEGSNIVVSAAPQAARVSSVTVAAAVRRYFPNVARV